MGASGASVGEELFDLLDQDHDGNLSQKEFKQAAASLRKYDLDDDGTLAFNELRALRNPYGGRASGTTGNERTPIFTLSTARSLSEIINRLEARYAQNSLVSAINNASTKNRGFTEFQIGLRGETFNQFDVDSDGWLDYDEVRVFLKNPTPTLELTIRLGNREQSEPVVDVWPLDAEVDVEVRKSSDGLVSIVLGNVQIEVGSSALEGNIAKRYFLAQFKALDRDNNNYLEQKEIRQNRNFEAVFDEFDRDGDGKLFRNEMVSVVNSKSQSARSRTRMTMTNRGHDLFQILDRNRDRRLGSRELKEALKRISLWDSDKDGTVSLSEVPQLFQMSFGQGQPTFPGVRLPRPAGASLRANPASTSASGPVWFRKMDRNADGDVSWREFLGSKAIFDNLDKNGDGLIDVIEALEMP